MYMPNIKWHHCSSLKDASNLLRRLAPDARLLAGGTDLLVDLKSGRSNVKHLISLNGLQELRGVTESDEGIRIGALTTITQLGRSKIICDRFPAILDAVNNMAAPPIRNVATIGGNIISAVSCADLPPVLMVLSSELQLWLPDQQRTLTLEKIFVGPRRTALRDGEVLTSIFIPDPKPGFGAAYERFGLREGNAIAVAAVAAGLTLDDNNCIQDLRLAIGAVAPIPKLVAKVNDILVGRVADESSYREAARIAREAADPISDVRGTAQYRRELVEVLTQRALINAAHRARKAQP